MRVSIVQRPESAAERAVLALVRATPEGCVPSALLERLQSKGLARDEVRTAVSVLWDRGVILLGTDRKLHLGV